MFDKSKLKKCGKGVQIFENVIITNPENVEIDDYARIDDFVKIIGTGGVKIGKYVHIASFSSVIGRGGFEIGDYSGLSCYCHVMTEAADESGKCMTNAPIPSEFRQYYDIGKVIIGKYVDISTGNVIFPNVKIATGIVTMVNTVINNDLTFPWTIYGGSPARPVKSRESKIILKMEKELEKRYGSTT